jgi:hypothetical protein
MVRELTIWDGDGSPTKLPMVADDKRPLVRSYKPTNASDPGRIRTVQWELWGPIGASRESISGILATDYVQNLDTRFPKRLISKGARNAIDLTTEDPSGVSGTTIIGEVILGSVTNKLGGAISTSDNVTHFDEQASRIFAHRGKLSTQVAISGWTVEATEVHPEPVMGAVSWTGKGRVGLGGAAVMRTRTAVSATGSTYVETTDILGNSIYAGPLAVGSDRCWFITRDSTGAFENMTAYTLDDFQTTANPFQIGDPRVKANGIGPLGPFTFEGKASGLFSFTDQNKVVPLSRALQGHLSTNNGKQWADPGWGWNYVITDIGLRAVTSHIDNPVGIGERMREFTGHSGRPTAIWAERGELFVAYLNGTETYAYRGVFGAQTSETGQPDFYPWWYRASTTCEAIFSTNTPTNTAVVWGEGTNMAYETIDRVGRDDLFTSRTYSVVGGSWYGTELDRDPHMLKVLRLNRARAKGMTSGSTWTVAWSFDNGSYVELPEITETGYHTVRPVQEQVNVPMDDISGRTMKPRIVQVAAGSGASTTPPELNGTLEVEYDERPEVVEVIGVGIQVSTAGMSKQGLINKLKSLLGSRSGGPLRMRFSDEDADFYGLVADVTNRRDIKADAVEAVDVIIQKWDVA